MGDRTYLVRFYPAKRTGSGSIQITFSLVQGSKEHRISAANLQDMLRQVKDLAAEYGQSCSASVNVPRGERKPPGFDKATSGTMFYEYQVDNSTATV
jgi:hypothetical protein